MAYQFFSQIDILASAVGEDEQNIPVALVVTDGRFATTGNGGHVENTDASGGASGGLTVPADLVVGPNEDGSSEYDFEFVSYNAATGYMEFWVKIVALSSSVDTPVIFAYGDSEVTTSQEDVTGVWDANFKGAYHLKDATTSTVLDSTSNDNDGTKKGANEPIEATGNIGKAQEFDGTDDFIAIATPSDFDSANITILAWFKGTTDSAGVVFYIRDVDGSEKSFFVIGDGASGNLDDELITIMTNRGGGKDNRVAYTTLTRTELFDGNWHQIGMVADTSDYKIYLDGASKLVSVGWGANDGDWGGITATEAWVSRTVADGEFQLTDILDELHVSDCTRSLHWIATSYNNQVSPAPSGTFWSALGTEETVLLALTADAIIKKVLTGSFTADAYLASVARAIFADAVIFKTQQSSIIADAILKKTPSGSLVADGVLHKTESDALDADAILLQTSSGSLAVDGVLLKTISDAIPADAYLTYGLFADAVILKTQTASFSADAIIFPVQHIFMKAGPIYIPVYPLT